MALCERRPAQVIQPPDEFVMVLSEHEAAGLRSLLGLRIGASALEHYGLTGVYDALADAKAPSTPGFGRGVVGFLTMGDRA